MNLEKVGPSFRRAWMLLLLLLVTLLVWPREARSQTTTAPGTSPSQTVETSGSASSPAPQPQPDTHPLAGGFLYTLGSLPEVQSYVQPALTLGEEAGTNGGYLLNGTHSIETVTVPMGSLGLDLLGKRNDFQAHYLGGGFLYNSDFSKSTVFQVAQLVDTLSFQRGAVSVGDFFSYMPSAGFGLAGAGVLGGFGSGLFGGFGTGSGSGQLNPIFGENESILGPGYGAYANTGLVQVRYSLTARTSVSTMGSYGFLKFGSSSAYISGNTVNGLVGLDHALSARDTVGVMYNYSTFHYVGSPVSFNSQVASFTYGRKVTGRLSFQAYAGPALITSRNSEGLTVHQFSGSGVVAMRYARERTSVNFYGGHFASGGSGILEGASTTMVSGGVSRRLTQRWTASLYGGYSRNSAYRFTTSTRSGSYGYWFGNFMLERVLSRHLRLHLGYEYARQGTPRGPCTHEPCLNNVNPQYFGIGITYIPRPFGL